MAAAGVVVGMTGLVAAAGVEPALAKGSPMAPVHERYEPGDTVTMIGYTTGGRIGDLEGDGPFQAYLGVGAPSFEGTTLNDGDDIPVGEVQLEEVEAWGSPAVRASVTFTLPPDIETGTYYVTTCGAGCTSTGPGDLMGGEIGVNRSPRIERWWPPEEPAIAELPDEALIYDVPTGTYYRADDVRRGEVTGGGNAEPEVASETARTGDDDGQAALGGERRAGASHSSGDDDETDVAGIVPWLLGAVLLGAVGVGTTVRRARRHGAVAAATPSSTVVDGGGGGGDDEAVGRGPGA